MTVGSHVFDRAHFDAWRIHRHDDFADALMGRTFVAGATNQIAIVGLLAETCPYFLAVNHKLVAVAGCKGFQ